jgi:hypothetical protein
MVMMVVMVVMRGRCRCGRSSTSFHSFINSHILLISLLIFIECVFIWTFLLVVKLMPRSTHRFRQIEVLVRSMQSTNVVPLLFTESKERIRRSLRRIWITRRFWSRRGTSASFPTSGSSSTTFSCSGVLHNNVETWVRWLGAGRRVVYRWRRRLFRKSCIRGSSGTTSSAGSGRLGTNGFLLFNLHHHISISSLQRIYR